MLSFNAIKRDGDILIEIFLQKHNGNPILNKAKTYKEHDLASETPTKSSYTA